MTATLNKRGGPVSHLIPQGVRGLAHPLQAYMGYPHQAVKISTPAKEKG